MMRDEKDVILHVEERGWKRRQRNRGGRRNKKENKRTDKSHIVCI